MASIHADGAAADQAKEEPAAPKHGPAALMVMCLAVLALATFTFAVRLILTRTRATWIGPLPAALAVVGAHTGRDRDPPCLIRLSIHRC